MSRAYQLKRRAELQDQTRQRIVEAAVDLHQTVGPAATTVSDIAERAGVGRVTVYRHFPDEDSLLGACSGHYFEQHPLPDPDAWRTIADPELRLGKALEETYAYHAETEAMQSRALRDKGQEPVMAPYHEHWQRAAEVLMAGWGVRGRRRRLLRAAIALALSFHTWHALVREQGLDVGEAVEVAARLAGQSAGRS
jgi:AcrR family transcriptional regulator